MSEENQPKITLNALVNLSKRRGFVWQNSEIYGGMANLYEFGPYGFLLEQNIKNLWFKHMVQPRDDMVPIDGMILMHPRAWEASGHVSGFTDPLVDCKNCHKRFRADQLPEWKVEKDNQTGEWRVLKQGTLDCPECDGELIPEVKPFNLLMETHLGAVQDEKSLAYLKGESCQNIYLNYGLVRDLMRKKLPFGIAQVGKAFRNEITLGPFIFRLREFEQMDIEFYCHPKQADEWYEYWKKQRWDWFVDVLGINEKNLKWWRHPDDERIFYAKDAYDIMYNYPIGWSELEGVHHRSDYDCRQQSKFSGQELDYFDQETSERFYPYIIETSVGVARIFLSVLTEAYQEDTVKDQKRIYLKFKPAVAPVKIAVLPLVKADEKLVKVAREIYDELKEDYWVEYDEAGSIGRRYRRQDEIGTPWCVTADSQTLKDQTVTIRDRDTLKQDRLNISELPIWLSEQLS